MFPATKLKWAKAVPTIQFAVPQFRSINVVFDRGERSILLEIRQDTRTEELRDLSRSLAEMADDIDSIRRTYDAATEG